jgi:hypothetical protein
MATLKLRVLERIDDRGLIKLSCVDEGEPELYTSDTEGATPPIGGEITGIGDTILEVLDIPLLAAADDYPGIYIAATSPSTSWPGCVIARSTDDGTSYTNIGSIRKRAAIGYATTVLPEWEGGNILDPNSFEVQMVGGSAPSSTTWAGMLSGANRALLGDEVLHFKTVTAVSAGVYRLTGLLRARCGTEDAMAEHYAGERFVLLNDAVARFESPLSIVGQDVIYRGTTFGNLAVNGYTAEITEAQTGMIPLSPVYLAVGYAGSSGYVARWIRRTRYPAPWLDGADAPLGETAELYRATVWNSLSASTDVETTTETYTMGAGLTALAYYPVTVRALGVLEGHEATTTIG